MQNEEDGELDEFRAESLVYIQRCREYISDYDEGIKQQLASIDMESKLYIAIQCI